MTVNVSPELICTFVSVYGWVNIIAMLSGKATGEGIVLAGEVGDAEALGAIGAADGWKRRRRFDPLTARRN
jgi:hypothetical protein